MKKITTSVAMLCCTLIFNSFLFAQDLNTVLNKHFEAVGQTQKSQIQSIFLEIKEVNADNEEKMYSVIKKKTNKIRIEGVWEGENYISAYDGVRAWTIAPWTGVSIPQLMTMKEIDDIKSVDGIDSPLLKFQQNGDDMVYSKVTMEDSATYHLLRVSSFEYPVMEYYLDETYLIYKSLRYDRSNATKVVEEKLYKNYKAHNISGKGDIQMAMVLEVINNEVKTEQVIEEVILGFGAPNSFFTKPD